MLLIEVEIWGPRASDNFLFLLDTGSSRTIVDPAVVDNLGYSPRMGRNFSFLAGLGGIREGYELDVMRLRMMGFELVSCPVLCHEIETSFGFDGLIGMDLLESHVVKLDGPNGWIEVD